uniref:Bravo_FIGEY domain-containing protein n=1 Tax=Angiostrongylus cantonensis TaxID=6313 RepID=A0A0K0D7W1_ANGCA
LTGGHLEKLTGSEELDEEEYERIRCAGGTVDEVDYGEFLYQKRR